MLTPINYAYVLEKVAMAAGLLLFAVKLYVSFVLPVWSSDLPLWAIVGEATPAHTLMGLCVFFLTFECVCNGAAELTRTASRKHYGAFWNATSFMEFSREWNKIVHSWLHLYICACAPTRARCECERV
jgi:sterol O-acyltransferase